MLRGARLSRTCEMRTVLPLVCFPNYRIPLTELDRSIEALTLTRARNTASSRKRGITFRHAAQSGITLANNALRTFRDHSTHACALALPLLLSPVKRNNMTKRNTARTFERSSPLHQMRTRAYFAQHALACREIPQPRIGAVINVRRAAHNAVTRNRMLFDRFRRFNLLPAATCASSYLYEKGRAFFPANNDQLLPPFSFSFSFSLSSYARFMNFARLASKYRTEETQEKRIFLALLLPPHLSRRISHGDSEEYDRREHFHARNQPNMTYSLAAASTWTTCDSMVSDNRFRFGTLLLILETRHFDHALMIARFLQTSVMSRETACGAHVRTRAEIFTRHSTSGLLMVHEPTPSAISHRLSCTRIQLLDRGSN